MNHPGQQRLKDTLELVRIAYASTNRETFREKILNNLAQTLRVDQAIFILQDNDFKYTDFATKNIEEKYVRSFKEYYHQHDPFHLVLGAINRRIIHLKQLVSYPAFLRSEYYNDFLRPQQIYHKLMVCLGQKDNLQGMITLFRPKGSRDFSAEEVSLLRTLSPYIRDALCGIKFLKKLEFVGTWDILYNPCQAKNKTL